MVSKYEIYKRLEGTYKYLCIELYKLTVIIYMTYGLWKWTLLKMRHCPIF